MAIYKFRIVIALLIAVVAVAAEPISFDDFLQCVEDAVVSEMSDDNPDSPKLSVSKLPDEILRFMKEELYDNNVVENFATISKSELTKILRSDVKSRKIYFEEKKKAFESFITKVLAKDIKNYPDETSDEDPMKIMFLSKMTMDAVDKIIETTIIDKSVKLDENWKVFTLKDAFRTVFFYCKYPKEMATIFTPKMRVEIKEWLDDSATWGNWGFDDDAADSKDNSYAQEVPLKLEL